jgi:hypothetical protein
MHSEVERTHRKWLWPNSRQNTGICLDRLRKNMKILSQDSRNGTKKAQELPKLDFYHKEVYSFQNSSFKLLYESLT